MEGKEEGGKDGETINIAQKLLNGQGVKDVLKVHRSHAKNVVRHAQRRGESEESLLK